MPRTVAFLNRKGGVGKTSTVHHLGGTLARRGLRMLLVDADPQASLSQGLMGPDVAEDLDPRETIASILDDAGGLSPRELVRPTAFAEPLPAARVRGGRAAQPPRALGLGMTQFALRDALAEACEGFDLC